MVTVVLFVPGLRQVLSVHSYRLRCRQVVVVHFVEVEDLGSGR